MGGRDMWFGRNGLMGRKLSYAIITLLAVVFATVAYSYFSRPLLALVLQVKTFEKGPRKVTLVDTKGDSYERKFELGDNQGEPAFYVIELPRVMPKQIFVEALAAPGKFEVDRITLRSEELSYSWDSRGLCSMKTMSNGTIKSEQCAGIQPLLAIGDNSRLQISEIPQAIWIVKPKVGICAAVAVLMFSLAAGGWLARPIEPKEWQSVSLARVTWITVAAVYLMQFVAVWRYSVDVPFWEEWEYFLPQGLPRGLSWDWLFSFAGYHRVVPTKLMAWVNLKLFGLDFKLQKLFNYLLFGGLIGTLVILKNRIIGRQEFILFPAFLLFLLSPIAYENHSNSYQSQIHLLIIFALIALIHMYADGGAARSSLFFLVAIAAAINTFSAGMTMTAVLFPCWAGFIFYQMQTRGFRRKGALLLMAGIGMVSFTALSWLFSYRQPSDCTWISPFTGLFWDTFLNLVSFGFGIEKEHPVPGLLCLAVVLLPLALLWKDRAARREKGVWLVTTAILLFLAFLATIAVTRAVFVGTSKASRYAEFGLMLIPLASIAWWLALRNPVRRYAVLLVFWLACFITFRDDWSFSPYREGSQMDAFVLESLDDYTAGRGDGSFPWTHPKPLPPFFAGAAGLDVKFTRQFKALPGRPTHSADPSPVAHD